MDLICVDISSTKASIGDNAVLWGDEQLRVEVVANNSDTISYELLTELSVPLWVRSPVISKVSQLCLVTTLTTETKLVWVSTPIDSAWSSI